jgi:sec-independent protein translocase protein TatB
MEILGIGASELIFIVIIAIIILGPKDMQKAGRTLGRWLNQLVRSDGWKIFQRTSSELRNLPRNLMREANLEMKDLEQDMRRSIDPRPRPPAASPGRSPSSPLSTGVPPLDQSAPPPQPPAVNSDENKTDAN